MKSFATFAVFMLFTGILFGQTCPCCEGNYREFDFWVGSWKVLDSEENVVGTNEISIVEGKCVIQENWLGASGGTGVSMNYFNAADSTWNQVWVDNSGNPLVLKGRMEHGSMVMQSTPTMVNGKMAINQVSWTPNEDGTVLQEWVLIDEETQIKNLLFQGWYHKL